MRYIPIPTEYYEVNRALRTIQEKYDSTLPVYPEMDIAFEVENRCKIAYDRHSTPIMLIFEEEDWFWFKAKWL